MPYRSSASLLTYVPVSEEQTPYPINITTIPKPNHSLNSSRVWGIYSNRKRRGTVNGACDHQPLSSFHRESRKRNTLFHVADIISSEFWIWLSHSTMAQCYASSMRRFLLGFNDPNRGILAHFCHFDQPSWCKFTDSLSYRWAPFVKRAASAKPIGSKLPVGLRHRMLINLMIKIKQVSVEVCETKSALRFTENTIITYS